MRMIIKLDREKVEEVCEGLEKEIENTKRRIKEELDKEDYDEVFQLMLQLVRADGMLTGFQRVTGEIADTYIRSKE